MDILTIVLSVVLSSIVSYFISKKNIANSKISNLEYERDDAIEGLLFLLESDENRLDVNKFCRDVNKYVQTISIKHNHLVNLQNRSGTDNDKIIKLRQLFKNPFSDIRADKRIFTEDEMNNIKNHLHSLRSQPTKI